MSAAYVQHISGIAQTTGQTLVFPSNLNAGNTIVVGMAHSYLGCPPSISDSQGNTYTKHVNGTQPSGGDYFYVWTAPVGSSAANTITMTMACGSSRFACAWEVSGLTATPFDVSNVSANSANPVVAGALTTTTNGAFIFAMMRDNGGGAFTPMASWTERLDSTGHFVEDFIQTTAGSITPEATASGTPSNVVGYTAAFKATSGGGGTTLRPWILG